jgi:hypothetical protein
MALGAFTASVADGWLVAPIVDTIASASASASATGNGPSPNPLAAVAPLQAAALRALISVLRLANEWSIPFAAAALETHLVNALIRYATLFHAASPNPSPVATAAKPSPSPAAASAASTSGPADGSPKGGKATPAAAVKAPEKPTGKKDAKSPAPAPAASPSTVAKPPALVTEDAAPLVAFEYTTLSDDQSTWLHLMCLAFEAIEQLGALGGSKADWLPTGVVPLLFACARPFAYEPLTGKGATVDSRSILAQVCVT